MSSTIAIKQQNILAMRSGGFCAKCRAPLTEDATTLDAAQNLGYIAHIKGEKPDSARYDPSQPAAERNLYPNLMYVCGRCHPLIDKQESTYTVESLLEIKSNHETWVHAELNKGMLAVGFTELETVSRFILGKPHNPTEDFMVLTPEAKMSKNNLSSAILNEFKIGYGKQPEVQKFIDHMVVIDDDFPERLKAGFVEQYNKLRADGFTGDALFSALRTFASQGSVDIMKQAAALSILAYLFQKCEVFEH